jgi:hypothetical protein
MEGESTMKTIKRVKATDGLGNVSYVYQCTEDGPVRCVLSNQTPAGLEYAGVAKDQAGAAFELATAKDSNEMASILREIGSPNYTYEAQ